MSRLLILLLGFCFLSQQLIADEETPLSTRVRINGTFPKDPLIYNQLIEYYKSLLLRGFPENARQIERAEIAVIDSGNADAFITFSQRKFTKRRGGEKVRVLRRRAHILLSRGFIKDVFANESLAAFILFHEWAHYLQYLYHKEHMGEVDPQILEKDADETALRQMKLAGIDPRAVFHFLTTPEGQRLLTYKSNLYAGVVASHPNFELRLTFIQAVLVQILGEEEISASTPKPIPQSLSEPFRRIEPERPTAISQSQTGQESDNDSHPLQERFYTALSNFVESHFNDLSSLTLSNIESVLAGLDPVVTALVLGRERRMQLYSEELFVRKLLTSLEYQLIYKADGDQKLIKKSSTIFEKFKTKGFSENESARENARRSILKQQSTDGSLEFKNYKNRTLSQTKVLEDLKAKLDLDATERLIKALEFLGRGKINNVEDHAKSLSHLVHILQNSGVRANTIQAQLGKFALDYASLLRSLNDKNMQLVESDLHVLSLGEGLYGLMTSGHTRVMPYLPMSQLKNIEDARAKLETGFSVIVEILKSPGTPWWRDFYSPIDGYSLSLPLQRKLDEAKNRFVEHTANLTYSSYRERILGGLRLLADLKTVEDDKKTDVSVPRFLNLEAAKVKILAVEMVYTYLTSLDRVESKLSLHDIIDLLSLIEDSKFLDHAHLLAPRKRENLIKDYQSKALTALETLRHSGDKSQVLEIWIQLASLEANEQTDSFLEEHLIPQYEDNLIELSDAVFAADVFDNEFLRKHFLESFLRKNILPDVAQHEIFKRYKNANSSERSALWQDFSKFLETHAPEDGHGRTSFLDMVANELNVNRTELKRFEKLKNENATALDRQIAVWEKLPPARSHALAILDNNKNWMRVDRAHSSETDSFIKTAFQKSAGQRGLKSPFYRFDLNRSEKLQAILWPQLKPQNEGALTEGESIELIELWMKLSSNGATSFTDRLFKNEIHGLLTQIDPDQRTKFMNDILERQLVYDFEIRATLFRDFLEESEFLLRMKSSESAERAQAIRDFGDLLPRFFPEDSPVRAQLIEDISATILTDSHEAQIFDEYKRIKDAASVDEYTRLFNGIIDAIKTGSAYDKMMLLRFLRGDPIDELRLQSSLKKYLIVEDESILTARGLYQMNKRGLSGSIDAKAISVGDIILYLGTDRTQRLWNQLSPEAHAALINPLLVGNTGLLSTEKGRQVFLEHSIPIDPDFDNKEIERVYLDYLKTLHETGQDHIASFAQSFIFFSNRAGENRSLGHFLKDLFEAHGPLGIALGQRLGNLELFDEQSNAVLHDLKNNVKAYSRAAHYRLLSSVLDSASLPILAEKPLGAASLKEVVRVEYRAGNKEPEAFALYKYRAKETIERDGEFLRHFLVALIDRDPKRYGLLLPVFDNIYEKKLAETDPNLEIKSLELARFAHEGDWEHRSTNGWKFEVVMQSKTQRANVTTMRPLDSQSFQELSSDEKSMVAEQIVKVFSPEIFGNNDLGTQFSLVDPDIHMGNFLFDIESKTIFTFDRGQMIGVSKDWLDAYFEVFASIARLTIGLDQNTDATETERLYENLFSCLSKITGKSLPGDLKEDIRSLFESNTDIELNGEMIVSRAQNLQRLLGNYKISFPTSLQDWLNEIQNLLWFEKHTSDSSFQSDILSRVIALLNESDEINESKALNPAESCHNAFRLGNILSK